MFVHILVDMERMFIHNKKRLMRFLSLVAQSHSCVSYTTVYK